MLSPLRRLLDASNDDGRTPLHSAAADGRDEVLGRLLIAGANPQVTDQSGQTPLHLAVADGRGEAVKMLVIAEADLGARDRNRILLDLTAEWPRKASTPRSLRWSILRKLNLYVGATVATKRIPPTIQSAAANQTTAAGPYNRKQTG